MGSSVRQRQEAVTKKNGGATAVGVTVSFCLFRRRKVVHCRTRHWNACHRRDLVFAGANRSMHRSGNTTAKHNSENTGALDTAGVDDGIQCGFIIKSRDYSGTHCCTYNISPAISRNKILLFVCCCSHDFERYEGRG